MNRPKDTAAAAIQAYIEAGRAALKPSPVRLHHIPRWFSVLCNRAFREHGGYAPYHPRGKGVGYMLREMGGSLDHYGSTVISGRRAFVSEPYASAVEGRHINNARVLADWIGADFFFDALSWWYPGRTVRFCYLERP